MAKAKLRAPTSLKKLERLIERFQEDAVEAEGTRLDAKDANDISSWLGYIFDSLTERKNYHAKQAIKKKLLFKVASEHLSADELEAIDQQAEAIVAMKMEKGESIDDDEDDDAEATS
jgi:hypothetical protein